MYESHTAHGIAIVPVTCILLERDFWLRHYRRKTDSSQTIKCLWHRPRRRNHPYFTSGCQSYEHKVSQNRTGSHKTTQICMPVVKCSFVGHHHDDDDDELTLSYIYK